MNGITFEALIREALEHMDCQKWLETHLTPEQKEIQDKIKAEKNN